MSKKHTDFWKWLITIYLIYIFIFIFLYYPNWSLSPYMIFVVFILICNFLGIFSIYRFIYNNNIGLRRLFSLSIFFFYILLLIFNTLFFTFGVIVINFSTYYHDFAGFIIDISGLLLPIISLYPVTKVFINIQLSRKYLLKYLCHGYLWGMWLMIVLAFGSTLLEIRKWTLYDYLSWSSIIFLLIGLFSYNFKRAIFPIRFWKVYFCTSIIWTIAECVYYFGGLKEYFVLPDYLKSYSPETEFPLVIYLIFFTLFFPIYIPLYKISFGKNFFKKK